MSIRKQVLFSFLGGFALFASCVALTWLTSDQFFAEGPDTKLASIIFYSWRWAYFLAWPFTKLVSSVDPYLHLTALTLGIFVESLVIYFVIRSVIARKRKNA